MLVHQFADDTTLIGLKSGGDESAYRWDIDHLVTWGSQSNFELSLRQWRSLWITERTKPLPSTSETKPT